jgi:type IV pilus assembly protein PilV
MSVKRRVVDRAYRQRGVTMIEVLVTLFVVAIGLLGMAGLQYASLKNANSSYSRYQATVLAHDIAERMRANRQYAIAGNYSGINVNGSEAVASCVASTCTPAEIKSRDAYEWGQQIKALPGGSGQVQLNAGVYTITVNWTEQQTGSTTGQAGATTDARSFSLAFRP